MGDRRKRRKRAAGLLETYRRIRKPMPPPERVIPDERRRLDEDRARREMRQPDEDEP